MKGQCIHCGHPERDHAYTRGRRCLYVSANPKKGPCGCPGFEEKIPFDPDYVIAPGETLKDWFVETGFGDEGIPAEVAAGHGIGEQQLARLFSGEEPITMRLGHQLANMTGIPATFWLSLEHNFRVGLAAGKTWSGAPQ